MNFDVKAKKKVTSDWADQFPDFRVWKPARLLKRHGPLIVGICLDADRSNENYTPKVHFHTLCIPFPTIALGLVGELEQQGIPRRVPLKRHAEEFQRIASELRAKYVFLDKKEFEFNDLVDATLNYLGGKHGRIGSTPFQHAPFEGIIAIAAYMKQTDYAQSTLDDCFRKMSNWPAHGLNIIGSAEKWRAKMQDLIDAPIDLQEVVNGQIVEHKLGGIPDYGLGWSSSPRRIS